MVVTGPGRKRCRGMENMLDGVNGDRGVFTDKVQDALDAQKAFAAHLGKNLGPGDKGIPMQRFVKGDAE